MAQLLRVLAALAEDLRSVPKTHIGVHNYNSSSWVSNVLFCPVGSCKHINSCTCAHTHAHENNIFKVYKINEKKKESVGARLNPDCNCVCLVSRRDCKRKESVLILTAMSV